MKALLSALVSFLLLTFASASYALTIDSFDDTCADPSGTCQQAQTPGINPSNGLSTPKAIGGARKISVSRTGGTQHVTAVASLGSYLHSQDVQVTGRSLITWDGATTGTTNPQGFGGVDFEQDGATAVIIKSFYADHMGKIKLTFFDASDATGASSWSFIYSVPADKIRVIYDLALPFSSFTPDNPGVQVNFNNIGAITMLVDGTAEADLDLTFELIATNGSCTDLNDIPNASGLVIDQCGQCITQNPALDNRSCVDCAGTPNGTAQTDRCGVCSGDGNSCLDCHEKDIMAIQTILDNSAKQQEAELKVVYGRIDRTAGRSNKKILKLTQTLRAEVHKLQIRNWTISWTFPSITRTCTNTTFCVETSNEGLWNEYQTHAQALRQMMVDAVALLKKIQKNKSKTFGASYLAKMDATYAQAISYLKQVPKTQANCS